MKSEKRKTKAMALTVCVVIMVVSAFTALIAIPGAAFESSNTEPAEEMDIEGLQQWVYDQGYSYAVAENWVIRLSPEDREALCGYKPLEAPKEPISENVRFISDVPKAKVESEKLESLPTSYDGMALGYVTPIKNQGYPRSCGSCWIFGATADFESDVAIAESKLLDFSEQEVGDCNIWSRVGGYDFCKGGNRWMTNNYFTKHGSADEACHPYAATPQTCKNCPILKNVDNARLITGSNGESQITTIKNAILTYGPVQASMYASDPGFKAYSGGVYEYWGTEGTNHAIEIIGWDDTKKHSHGSGAWMLKNSWGTTWGASGPYPGCAWVAYSAANLGDNTNAIASYKNPGDVIFYHDECGWMGWSYGTSQPTAYGAVRFTPKQDSTLTAVDFWTPSSSMSYEIKIFDTLNTFPTYYTFSNQLGTTQTGTTNEQGYYSIPLNMPVELVSRDDFIVQVKLTSSAGWPIPIDYYDIYWLPAWSTITTFSGESYYSTAGLQFTKPSVSAANVDVGIRARAGAIIPPKISVKTDKFKYCPCNEMLITIDISNPTSSPVTFKWYLGAPTFGYWGKFYSTKLPAGFEDTFEVPFHIGEWGKTPFSAVWYVDLQDPETGQELAADCACWSYCPTCRGAAAMSISMSMPPLEDIATEIGEEIEGIA